MYDCGMHTHATHRLAAECALFRSNPEAWSELMDAQGQPGEVLRHEGEVVGRIIHVE